MHKEPITLTGKLHINHGIIFDVAVNKGDARFAIIDGGFVWEVHDGTAWQPFDLPLGTIPQIPALSHADRRKLIDEVSTYYRSLFAPDDPTTALYEPESRIYYTITISIPGCSRLEKFITGLAKAA